MKAVYFIENDSHHRQNVKRLSFYICNKLLVIKLSLFIAFISRWWVMMKEIFFPKKCRDQKKAVNRVFGSVFMVFGWCWWCTEILRLLESDDNCKTKYEAQRGRGGNCLKLFWKEKFGTLEISFEALVGLSTCLQKWILTWL